MTDEITIAIPNKKDFQTRIKFTVMFLQKYAPTWFPEEYYPRFN